MACTHTADCPLFPKLHASRAAWRTHYCDTETQWTTCARYERAVKGQPVPIALLPNGKVIGMVAEHEAELTTASPVMGHESEQLTTAIKPSLWKRLFGKGKE